MGTVFKYQIDLNTEGNSSIPGYTYLEKFSVRFMLFTALYCRRVTSLACHIIHYPFTKLFYRELKTTKDN